MGGRIDVESLPGRGTTFTVWLSTERIPAQQRRCAARALEGPSETPELDS